MQKLLTWVAASALMMIVTGGAAVAEPGYPGSCRSGNILPADGYESSYPVYVVQDELLSNGYLYTLWVYAESNGQPGLQRCPVECGSGGEVPCDSILF